MNDLVNVTGRKIRNVPHRTPRAEMNVLNNLLQRLVLNYAKLCRLWFSASLSLWASTSEPMLCLFCVFAFVFASQVLFIQYQLVINWPMSKNVTIKPMLLLLLFLVLCAFRSWSCFYCLPQGCDYDASVSPLGLSLLHDAYIPRPGQSGETHSCHGHTQMQFMGSRWLGHSYSYFVLVICNRGKVFSAPVCVCGEFSDGCGGHVPRDVQERLPQRAAHSRHVCSLLPHWAHNVYGGKFHLGWSSLTSWYCIAFIYAHALYW